MPGFISGDPLESPGVEAEGSNQVPATTGQVISATFGSDMASGLTARISQDYNLPSIGGIRDPRIPQTFEGESTAPSGPAFTIPTLSADDANKQFGIKGPTPDTSLNFTGPVPQNVAQQRFEHQTAENVRQDTISRAQPGLLTSAPARLVYGLAAGFTDPLNLAAAFVPGLGEANEARIAAQAGGGFIGRTLARAASGVVAGAGQAAALEPLTAALDSTEGKDWSIGQAFRDIAFGSLLGGGLHMVGGTAADALGRETPTEPVPAAIDNLSAEGRKTVLQGALAQALEERPPNMQPVMDLAPLAEPGLPFIQSQWRPGSFDATSVFTGAGQRIDVRPEVVDLSDLISSHGADGTVNPDYPAELQPRDRSAAASQAQIASIAGGLQPDRLGIGADASTGAPIVGPDGVVESGNGRVAALTKVYSDPSFQRQADAYHSFILNQGYDTAGFSNPVLIGRRITDLSPEERQQLTLGANERSTLAMSAAERGKADQGRIDKALDLWRGGDVGAAINRDFVRSFMAQLSPEERGGMMLPDGGISAEGERRIQSGLLARAYGDGLGPTLDRFLNSDAEGMKNIAGSMSDAAGVWGQMRSASARGDIPTGMDITRDLSAAVQTIEAARKGGVRVRDLAAQSDLDRPPLSDTATTLLRAFYRDAEMTRPMGRATIGEALTRYAAEALKATPGPDLFGGAAPTANAVLQAAVERAAARPTQAAADLVASMRATDPGAQRATAAADAAMKKPPMTKTSDALAKIQADVAALEKSMFPAPRAAARDERVVRDTRLELEEGSSPSQTVNPDVITSSDLWRVAPGHLEEMLTESKTRDKADLVTALGETKAAEWRKLEVQSRSIDTRKADAAAKKMENIEATFTERQRALIYGEGDTRPQADEIQQVLAAHQDRTDDPMDAAYSAALAMRGTADASEIMAVPKGDATASAQAAYVRLRNAYEDMAAAGVPANDAGAAVAKALVERGGWKARDAAEIVGGFTEDAQRASQSANPAQTARGLEAPKLPDRTSTANEAPAERAAAQPSLPPEIEAANALVDAAEKRSAARDAIAACAGVIGA